MAKQEVSFRQMRSDLDNIILSFQSNELDADEALELYKKGQALIKQIDEYLKKSENTVKKLNVNIE
jgi:exodeoxyribonuclease VII small subunit